MYKTPVASAVTTPLRLVCLTAKLVLKIKVVSQAEWASSAFTLKADALTCKVHLGGQQLQRPPKLPEQHPACQLQLCCCTPAATTECRHCQSQAGCLSCWAALRYGSPALLESAVKVFAAACRRCVSECPSHSWERS